VGDPAAVGVARDVVERLAALDAHGGRPRRLAVACLDLALALVRQGHADEAVHHAAAAVESGRVAPSSRWRALDVLQLAEATGTRAAAPLRELMRTH
jgi:hypothetical protein